MFGTLYSPARHESQTVELVLQVKKPKSSNSKEIKDKEAKEKVETGGEHAAPLIRTSETARQPTQPASTPSVSSKN